MALSHAEQHLNDRGARGGSMEARGRGARISPRLLGEAISRGASQPRLLETAPSGEPDNPDLEPCARRMSPDIDEITVCLGHDVARLGQGRAVLGLCGDGLRRRMIETLAAHPRTAVREMIDQFEAPRSDIDNRLATLKRVDLVRKGRFATYSLEPDALLGIRIYFDVLAAAAAWSRGRCVHGADLDNIFEALADPTRRTIFEHIVVRPRRVGELGQMMPMTRQAVSHHIRGLSEAGLIEHGPRSVSVVADLLPGLRTYFDRLWLEASPGDTWLMDRKATNSDYGL